MVKRRRAFGLVLTMAMMCSASALAQKDEKRKLDDTQKKEIQNVVKILDQVVAGKTPSPNDLSLAWVHQDFLKAEGGKEFVPFILTIDPSPVTTGNVVVYSRVVKAAGAAAPTDPPAAAKGDKDEKAEGEGFAWEDISTKIPVPNQKGPMQIERSFSAPSGDYDVYVVVKELQPKKGDAKVSVLKQSVSVPDFWDDQLDTSSVMLADSVQELSSPVKPEELTSRPYAALGAIEITPSLDNKFSKSEQLEVFMFIYNPKTDSANKPDVTVEFNFYQKAAGGEKFFNRTNPQNLNAQTLPPQFDMAAGHQLPGSVAVPLASFPEGDYRLEIKVTDKLAGKGLSRNVNFTVTGA
jgi:hypothetical protein